MSQFSWKWYYALKDKHEELFGGGVIPSKYGIYKWKRETENGIKCEYIGKAEKQSLFDRHFNYYCIQCGMRPFSKGRKPRPIELSLMKHPDWEFEVLETYNEPTNLAEREKFFIEKSCSQPFTKNYNVIWGSSEKQVKCGKNEALLNNYQKRLSKIFKNLKVDINEDNITLTTLRNKDFSVNKKSLECFNELIQEIKHWALENEIARK